MLCVAFVVRFVVSGSIAHMWLKVTCVAFCGAKMWCPKASRWAGGISAKAVWMEKRIRVGWLGWLDEMVILGS